MELLVLGIGVMALGATLIHLAMEGRRPELTPVAATGMPSRRPLFSVAKPEGRPQTQAPAPAPTQQLALARREDFSKTDVLLADALTELLMLKEQVNCLQAQVEALSSGAAAAPAHDAASKETRSAPRQIRRRAMRGVA